MRSNHFWTIVSLLLAASVYPAAAQELTIMEGLIHNSGSHSTSFAVEGEYMRPLSEHCAVSVAYLNEGHMPGRRRDGFPVQLWGRTRTGSDRLTLSAGIGPYFTLDTVTAPGGGDAYTNGHGLAGIASLDAAWRTGNRWTVHLRGNWVDAPHGGDALSVSLGMGYALSPEFCIVEEPQGQCLPLPTREQVTLSGGVDVINDLAQTKWTAVEELEYRRSLGRHTDWTVGLLHENSPQLARRLGLTSQVWVARPVSGEQWIVGLGAGGYLRLTETSDLPVAQPHPQQFCPVLSATAARQVSPRWVLRLTWHRLITNDDRDTDTILLGMGYDLRGTGF
jgi:hypothetical protein